MASSSLVAIAIIATSGMTKPMGNTSDAPRVRGDVEIACRSDHDPPDMSAHSRKPLWYHRPHLIAGLEAEIALVPLAMTCWEAQLVSIAHPTMPVTIGRDEQRDYLSADQ